MAACAFAFEPRVTIELMSQGPNQDHMKSLADGHQQSRNQSGARDQSRDPSGDRRVEAYACEVRGPTYRMQ